LTNFRVFSLVYLQIPAFLAGAARVSVLHPGQGHSRSSALYTRRYVTSDTSACSSLFVLLPWMVQPDTSVVMLPRILLPGAPGTSWSPGSFWPAPRFIQPRAPTL